jgi:hypothetical protein
VSAYEQRLSVSIAPWQKEQLVELATRRRTSLTEILRSAVRDYLSAHGYDQQ